MRHERRGSARRARPKRGAATDASIRVPRRRRDRRGRGVRGMVAPAQLPLHRTRGEQFDDLIMDAVEELEDHWGPELAGLEFAVEDVPDAHGDDFGSAEAVVDRGVPLGRLFRHGLDDIREPVVVVYRRPVEVRTPDIDDRADLVFMVVVDLVAEYLGRDVDELDPPR